MNVGCSLEGPSPESNAVDDRLGSDAMTTVQIKGFVAVEHGDDAGALSFSPGKPVPFPLKARDTVWVRAEVDDSLYYYGVSSVGQARYRVLWTGAPGAHSGERVPFSQGLTVGPDHEGMDSLFLVASSEPLAWLGASGEVDCSAQVGKMPVTPPQSACDHLYGLNWKIPPQPRGLVRPTVEFISLGGKTLGARVSEHQGETYTAVQFQFKPRS
jgi:hypothetical protein